MNNLGSLCFDATKQISILKGLEAGNIKGDAGEEGMKINYFEILTEKMKNELGSIVKCCSKVLNLSSKGRIGGSASAELNDKAWDNISMQCKSLG